LSWGEPKGGRNDWLNCGTGQKNARPIRRPKNDQRHTEKEEKRGLVEAAWGKRTLSFI